MCTDQLHRKYQRLQEILTGYGQVCVAFSSGVDSTFLLKAAKETLGEGVLAVTATAPFFPGRESEETRLFCQREGIRHIICRIDGLAIPQLRTNPPDRCYHCKKNLFLKMKEIASQNGIQVLAEGSNTDDDGDYRPGHIAIRELGILSPLREAGLSKDDIRQLSKEMGLASWDKPSFACLASRFPYGEEIDERKLAMVEKAEDHLLSLGFRQMRVRIHEGKAGDLIGRIELPEEDLDRMLSPDLRKDVREYLRGLGFAYVALDLAGFATGSMNRTLTEEVRRRGLTEGEEPSLKGEA